MRLRRSVLGATAAAVLGAGLAVAPASASTSAVTCSGWQNEGTFESYDQVKEDGRTAPIRTGPYGECAPVITLQGGYFVYIDCYVTNDYGNTWTYVSFKSVNERRYYGWIYDDHLVDGGSYERC
ncbi:hypothetical protein AB0L35_10755 [Streptomyces sp. NPDC052309]|uniref:SH3 domain-containing protein n=1 Tax=Streptomyces griseicoloratus TaxID=2752516 RepID=A0A926QR66_9ACTN|nr:hypothetical protein [Streptomyces griseicoloratus]MBD0420325.1 hypothetical protein [Streptomyces griseicoloratus]